MVHRTKDGDEAQRWKRKFLDALEEHEHREKALSHRIKLLRRGLLGVSLAGEGQDGALDKQLTELRRSLRTDDREAGLELLLEQIEKSIVRLDNEKNQSAWALQQAFTAAISELQQAPLPASCRRQLKKFSRQLPSLVQDTEQHASLIRQFIELLREAVVELRQAEQHAAVAARELKQETPGFWQKIFSGRAKVPADLSAAQGESTGDGDYREPQRSTSEIFREDYADPAGSPLEDESDPNENAESAFDGQNEKQALDLEISPGHGSVYGDGIAIDNKQGQNGHPNAENATDGVSPRRIINASLTSGANNNKGPADLDVSAADASSADLNCEYEAFPEPSAQIDAEKDNAVDATVSLEGELIRDRSGLQEPAFSYIAGHVEPLLLRILESIHITGESVALAESARRHIVKGLNWYDFVAVLEEILQVLRNAADEQRAEFQGFLSEVNDSLAQVQAYVDNSRKHADEVAATDAEMDARVRKQIGGIANAVEDDDTDIDALKLAVQSQIGDILGALDGFRSKRTIQDETLATEMREMVTRISTLEEESREMRLHLARQHENALKDSLTELPNRDAYNQHLSLLLETWRRGASHERREDDRALCLAVADVDEFKRINDTYGHLAGDKVLKIIAREFISRLREKDFVARYGGEEFVIIMPDTRPADAEYALNKLREAIAGIPFHFKERHIVITVSFGVVSAGLEDTVETLFEKADSALYCAKEAGRNRVYRDRD